MTTHEKERLKEDAALAGLTVSAFVRRRTFGRSIIANVDSAMIRELRRLGGLAKAIYLATDGQHADKTGSILDQIRQLISRLSQDSDDRQKG
jgi:thymidylate synthase